MITGQKNRADPRTACNKITEVIAPTHFSQHGDALLWASDGSMKPASGRSHVRRQTAAAFHWTDGREFHMPTNFSTTQEEAKVESRWSPHVWLIHIGEKVNVALHTTPSYSLIISQRLIRSRASRRIEVSESIEWPSQAIPVIITRLDRCNSHMIVKHEKAHTDRTRYQRGCIIRQTSSLSSAENP